MTENSKKLKVYTHNKSYASFIRHNIDYAKEPNDSDLIIFVGGADVDPDMYKHEASVFTSSSINTDMADRALFYKAVQNEIPMIGICRGAQFLTVMLGGKLFQDVTGHAIARTHSVSISGKYLEKYRKDQEEDYEITSTHHQMMNPFAMKEGSYKIIAYTDRLSAWYLYGGDKFINPYKVYSAVNGKRGFVEPEIVLYPEVRALAIQGHPERMHTSENIVKLINDIIDNELLH